MNDTDRPDAPDLVASPTRRRLLKSLALVPLVAVGAGAVVLAARRPSKDDARGGRRRDDTPGAPYRPTFFNAAEWAFIVAACDRLIPHDEHGAGAVELGVPEFVDRHMRTPYAAGDIWYVQGPSLRASADFGYQRRLPLRDILRVGMAAMDAHCARAFGGRTFARLDAADRDKTLEGAQAGRLRWPEISDKQFFAQFLTEVRNGYFADPRHGRHKDMGAWKMTGYPGVRADERDWVGVRDEPYPIPPVGLAGRG